jgi:positive regulator of sigma E activity
MIRIDLRYVAPIVAFYLPPFMFLTLGWMVGYSISDMRETLVIVGAVLGSMFSIITAIFYSMEAAGPQWVYLRRGAKE